MGAGQRLYLAGLPGAGKSTVAARLAGLLGWGLYDVDREIEREAGRTIPEIWEEEGEAGFRRRERVAVERLVAREEPTVAALGGGTLEDASSRERLAAWGSGVHLAAEPETLAARLADTGSTRPLLAGGDPLERVRRLAAERGPRYGALPHRVASNGRTIDAVACEIARTIDRPPPEEIASGVWLGAGGLAHASSVLPATGGPTVVVTDDRVWALHGAALGAGLDDVRPCALAAGEAAKDASGLEAVWQALADAGADRDTPVAVLGGGAACDVGGLAAATFKRGLPLALFPTTLLAQVDAAIGGKNAIDFAGVKNLVGTFHLPVAVVVDPLCVLTLPDRDYRSGWAEIVKAGLIGDADLFDACEAKASAMIERRLDVVGAAIRNAIVVKTAVVEEDLREAGPRRVLNLGHTLGHAFEAVGGGEWTHGESIAMGTVSAATLGERLGVTEPGLADRIAATLAGFGLPTVPPSGLDPGSLLATIRHDKKRGGGRLHAVLPVRPGEVVIRELDEGEVEAWVRSAVA